MRIEVEIPDSKVDQFLDHIRNLPFIIGSRILIDAPGKKSKESLKQDLRETLEEVRLHKEGKLELNTLQKLLDEL